MDSQKVLFTIMFALVSGLVLMTFWQYNITNFFTGFDGGKVSNAISRLENIERADRIKSCDEVLEKMASNRIIRKFGRNFYTIDLENEVRIRRTNSQSTRTITIDEDRIICELYLIEVDFSIEEISDHYTEKDSYDEPRETKFDTELNELSKKFINEFKSKERISLVDETGNLESFGTIEPKRVVIHHTGGPSWEGAYNTLRASGLGAHFIIERDGTIRKYANLDRGTYHACSANYETIGIEIVNDGRTQEYTSEQYYATRKIIEFLENNLNNRLNPFVIGHFEVDKYYPDRFERFNCDRGKWDPSPDFEWSRIGVDKDQNIINELCQRVKNSYGESYTKECYNV